MIVTASLFCCLHNIPLCMKLRETEQKAFQSHYLTKACGISNQCVYVMEDASVYELPAGRFLCLVVVSWQYADQSQSHGGIHPPRCGWGNTWSQPLRPGSWAEVLAARGRLLFVFVMAVIQYNLAESWVQAVLLYLIARNHTSPEGCIHKTFPRRLPQLVAKVTQCSGWRDAISAQYSQINKGVKLNSPFSLKYQF